jgi:hypothetical protein
VFTKIVSSVDHSRKHSANGLIAGVQVLEVFLRQIPCVESVIQPGLCLVRFADCFINLVDECRFITSAGPPFRIIALTARELFSNLIG